MNEIDKWRREADRRLAAPIQQERPITTVIGKVDDRFEQIMSARQRGMTWSTIALALGGDGEIKEESVESAFRRICAEKGLAMPRRKPVTKAPIKSKTPQAYKTPAVAPKASEADGTLFGERWVDNGDD
ncbi:hypothetical protein [Novosphingobium sp. KA1]|uniref:hypothetical protein n=1 Tax=Novosphingobium sp. (strain KA1) TaxID=164608 RepID=UPI001A8E9770|nr:hypothetical protein [Novosphingobium sp. KA1]QSR17435.1 hypothetical protein CA833_09605 [Novosphingobium sp. KA1]